MRDREDGSRGPEIGGRQAIAAIQKLAQANRVPILIFQDEASMKELLEDMRLGASIKAGLKRLNIPYAPEQVM